MADMRTATAADDQLVGDILADAFFDDPVMTWVSDRPDRRAVLDVVLGFSARAVLLSLGTVTVLGDAACALWTPPGAGEWDDELLGRFFAELGDVATPDEIGRVMALGTVMTEHHPVEPHWYLGEIGVRRDRQGQGLGDALLRATLERVDAEHMPAYLEATCPRSVPLYQRHGFVVRGEIPLADGPSMTGMWREAR